MFNPYNSSGLNFFWPSGGGNSTQNGGVVVGGAYAVLTSGETIDAARTFSTGNTATLLANWRAGATGYLGFRFLNPSTTTINYGYAQFTTTGASTSTPSDRTPTTFWPAVRIASTARYCTIVAPSARARLASAFAVEDGSA